MSISEDDHNYYSLDPHRQPSLPSGYEPSPIRYSRLVQNRVSHTPEPTSNARYSIAPLPALAYTPSPRSRVKPSPVSTSFEQYTSNASVNGFITEPPNDECSSDPHDFYRRYRDPFGRGLGEPLGQADIVVAGREEGVTASKYPHRESPISARSNGTKLASRLYDHPVFRSSPSALNNKGQPSQPKSNPSLTSPSRNRQTSLKELVNKFNQTPDEPPPLPKKSVTHNTLSASSAVPSSAPFTRGRTSSQSKGSGARFVSQESSSGAEQLPRPTKVGQRRRRRDSGISPSPTSTQSSRSQLHEEPVASNTYVSHSVLHQIPKEEGTLRKPLFGELLALDTDKKDPSYGIPRPWRRRGSEGSMHSPNPMFSDYRQNQDLLISPTSWSPVFMTSPEDIRSERKSTSHSPGLHRRARSDIASKANAPSALGKHVSVMSPSRDQPSPITSPNMKRNSQSRIPISTRRRSTTSESGHSATSTRPNSVMSRTPTQRVQSPQGSTASVESLQRSASPSRTPRATPVKSSARHNHGLTIQHVKPNSLHAIITATSTQKSPPLRGSRTRQPVSTASTAASRARTAERFGHGENGPKSPKERRPKKLPELGQVDFAARRQAISQAFTKSIQENERKEELEAERRLTSRTLLGLQNGGKRKEGEEPDEASGVSDFSGIHEEQSNNEEAPESEPHVFEHVSQLQPKTERDLTINTAHLSERSVLDLRQEDSPTLGLDDQFGIIDHSEGKDVTPPSEAEPLSAVTASTNDTADTFFDNEPQEDEASPSENRRSLLSHVMSMRESSPASMRQVATTDGSSSDRDDEISIHIMLRNTPVEAHTDESNNLYGDLFKRVPPKEKLEAEAKTGSWNLSNVSKDYQALDRDPVIPMEKIDEHSMQAPGESAHTSYSTIASTTLSNDTQQPWSPAPLSSPATDRSTLDSDTYSTINGILNHYHNPSVLSPDLMNDFQQQMMRQTPDLAKQGGWDPKKVTQLYLQKFAHGRFAQTNNLPERSNSPTPRGHTSRTPSSNLIENSHTITSSREQLTTTDPARVSLEVVGDGDGPQRASLNNADDWASVSPSIMDYMPHQADIADSPEESMPPPLPPKNDIKATKKNGVSDISANSHSSVDLRPELPAIQGTGGDLGLAINIEPPHDVDPPQLRKPPSLPGYAPPPPPEILVQNRLSDEFVQYPSTNHRTNDRPEGPNATSPPIGIGETPYQLPTRNEPADSPGSVIPLDGPNKTHSPTPEQKRLTRRRHIIKELVDTEHSFGQDMKVVDDIYKGTSNVIVVPAEDVKVLFGNSDQIVSFSTNFLDALKQASKSVYVLPKSKRWRSKRSSVATSNSGDTEDQSSVYDPELTDDEKDRKTFIGEAFGHHMPQMEKVYAEYLKNHDAANQKLQALQKNPNVQIWLKECRLYAHDLTSAWDLDSLLVKPVQRVLKYPLLLDQLLDATPESHPDYTALDIAARGLKGLSMRINEMKKRADLMEQVTNRKRKDSDIRLFKGLISRTERLKQKVGTTDMYEDKEYSAVTQKFGTNFFQLQVVMRDVEMYTSDVQGFVTRFCDFVMAIEAYMDVGQTSYPETESKWRKFRLTSREITMTALTDHVSSLRSLLILLWKADRHRSPLSVKTSLTP